MKKYLLAILFLVFLIGCKERESRVEIIPNLEEEYLSKNEVDAEPIESKDFDFNKELIEAIKIISAPNINDTMRYNIRLAIYINEKGNVDKIKDISSFYDRVEYGTDGIKNYQEREKINQALAKKMSNWKFEPAKKNGKNVKYWTDDFKVDVLNTPDGKYKVELPNFLTGMFGSGENYLTEANVMPMPVGGMTEISDQIIYPQIAKLAGIEGKVFIRAFIDENGTVTDAKIIRGIGAGCDEAALGAVKQTKFNPGIQNGKPVKVQVTIPIVFKLQ